MIVGNRMARWMIIIMLLIVVLVTSVMGNREDKYIRENGVSATASLKWSNVQFNRGYSFTQPGTKFMVGMTHAATYEFKGQDGEKYGVKFLTARKNKVTPVKTVYYLQEDMRRHTFEDSSRFVWVPSMLIFAFIALVVEYLVYAFGSNRDEEGQW